MCDRCGGVSTAPVPLGQAVVIKTSIHGISGSVCMNTKELPIAGIHADACSLASQDTTMGCAVRASRYPKPVIAGGRGASCPVNHELLSKMRFVASSRRAIIAEDNRVLRGVLTDYSDSHVALEISQPKCVLRKIVGVDYPAANDRLLERPFTLRGGEQRPSNGSGRLQDCIGAYKEGRVDRQHKSFVDGVGAWLVSLQRPPAAAVSAASTLAVSVAATSVGAVLLVITELGTCAPDSTPLPLSVATPPGWPSADVGTASTSAAVRTTAPVCPLTLVTSLMISPSLLDPPEPVILPVAIIRLKGTHRQPARRDGHAQPSQVLAASAIRSESPPSNDSR